MSKPQIIRYRGKTEKSVKNYPLWGGDFKTILDENIASLRGLHRLHTPDL